MLSRSKLKNNLFVAQALASSVKTLLGPSHSVKCCLSEDESVICGNAAKLLQFIDVQHPAGFVINDACQGLHKTYGKGCKTLVCLIGFWSRAAEDLLDKGVPVPIIVRLFQEALDHCLSVLRSVAIPLDVRKFDVNETANSSSPTAVEERSDGHKRASTKHSITDDLNLSCAISRLITVPADNPTSACREGKVFCGTRSNFASHLESHNLKFGQSDHCNIPNVSSEEVLNLADVEVESFDNDEDVSWFFDSHFDSDSINLVEGCCQPHSKFSSKPTIPRSVCITSKQNRNGSLLEDGILKKQLDQRKRLACCDTSDACISNEHKSGFSEVCTNASKEESVTLQHNWKKCDSYSTPLSLFNQKLGKTESTLRLENVELSERFANLLQEKENRTKPRIDSFCKYSRSISVCESPQSTQKDFSSDARSLPFIVDSDNPKKNCELTESGSDDEFSSCFDNIPKPTDIAFKVTPVSSSKAPRNKARKINLNPERNNIENSDKNLFQQKQKEIASALGRVNLSKYSRVASDIKRSGSEDKIKIPSDTSVVSQTDVDIVNASSLIDTQRVDTVNSLQTLGKRLSHGREKEMDLAARVVQAQINYAGRASSFETKVETTSIHVETIIGPPTFDSRVVDGLTIDVDVIDVSLLKKIFGKPLSFVLVNGDISPQFQHLGFKEPTPIKQILRSEDDLKKLKNDKHIWFERIEKILNKFKIDLVIVKGVVDDIVVNYCRTVGILVLQKVIHSKLQLLSVSFRVPLATYLTDIRSSEVGGPITLDFVQSGWTPVKYRRSSSKLISTAVQKMFFVVLRNVFVTEKSFSSYRLPVQTALITGPSRDIVCESEMNFWGCVYSLKNAISCKKVLPGAGSSERACIQELERLKQQVQVRKNPLVKLWTSSALNEFRPMVYSAFISGFEAYLMSVLLNSGQFTSGEHALTFLRERLKETGGQALPNMDCRPLSRVQQSDARDFRWNGSFSAVKLEEIIPKMEEDHSSGIVWDDFMSKCEAWRRAVGVVLILLQSDALVTTGVDRT